MGKSLGDDIQKVKCHPLTGSTNKDWQYDHIALVAKDEFLTRIKILNFFLTSTSLDVTSRVLTWDFKAEVDLKFQMIHTNIYLQKFVPQLVQ